MNWFKRLLGLKTSGTKQEIAQEKVEVPHRPAPSDGHLKSSAIELRVLQQLFPIRTLNEDALSAFVLNRKADIYPAGTVLFQAGQAMQWVHYLLDGTVRLETKEGKAYEVRAGTVKARFPLYSARLLGATAHAVTEIQVLQVSSKIMSHTAIRPESMSVILDPASEEIPKAVRDHEMFRAFCESYSSSKLQLPTLPAIAAKLSRALERDSSLKELAGHVQLDPVISARLIAVANSPLYHAGNPVNTCQDAIATLGMAATRSLVLGMCVHGLFRSRDSRIHRLLHEQWKRSLYLSALCYVLAEENGGISKEEALLAGLISDIGTIPFLFFLGTRPNIDWQPEDIDLALPWVRGPVGAYLLQQWAFPAELAAIPLLSEDWCYESDQALSLPDVVILSRLHAYLGTPRAAELPAINSLPAFSKLREGRLSPEHSLDMLVKAKHKINQTIQFFAA